MKAQLHFKLGVKYRLDIVRAGRVVKKGIWRDHMITDAGLDLLGTLNVTGGYTTMFSKCIIGTGAAVAVRRDSSPVTFTQSGTTLTASGNFFVSTDAGRLFKWGTGSSGVEVYISSFTSATQVTVATPATVSSPSVGTIWYVNTANLVTPVAGLTWSKDSSFTHTSLLTTSGSIATVTHTTVNISSAVSGPLTITEIAIHNSTTNTNVYDRDIVSPNVAMLAGDQAKVTIVATYSVSPITTQTVANFATGYNSAGNIQIESIKFPGLQSAIPSLTSAGSNQGSYQLDIGQTSLAQIALCTATPVISAFNAATAPTSIVLASGTGAYGTYTNGNRFIDQTITFGISAGNGTIGGIYVCSNSSNTERIFTLALTSTFVKTNVQTLTLTFRKSWSRTLTN